MKLRVEGIPASTELEAGFWGRLAQALSFCSQLGCKEVPTIWVHSTTHSGLHPHTNYHQFLKCLFAFHLHSVAATIIVEIGFDQLDGVQPSLSPWACPHLLPESRLTLVLVFFDCRDFSSAREFILVGQQHFLHCFVAMEDHCAP